MTDLVAVLGMDLVGESTQMLAGKPTGVQLDGVLQAHLKGG